MKRAIRLGAGLLILGVLVWRLGTGAFLNALGVIDTFSIAAALGIGLATTVLSAWRWRIVARALGLRLALPTAVADYYRALLLNAVLPGGVLGDVHRAVRHGQDTGNVGRGVRAVMLERFAGQIALIAAAVAVLAGRPGLLEALAPGPVLLAAGPVVAAVAFAIPAVRRTLCTAAVDVRRCLLGRTTWPVVLLLSPAVLLGHVALFVVAMRCAGSTASIGRLLPLILLALLAMGLPVNIGGWGPREAVSAVAFGATGLNAAQGVTAAVVYGLLTLVSSLPGALVLFRRRLIAERREMPAEQFDEVDEDRLALSGSGV